ncbi:MAG TPA: branched-chain amino acid ABC transporter ATP-binding protein/permease [Methylomirabilota bacterium]|nr:branched-chain amino acid ABC transporter ATP-binding protein/permease [Methylomirabilota bacterium]
MTEYVLAVGIVAGLNVLVALGLNVISGYAGQPHLGIAIYTGAGAYLSALLLVRAELAAPWTVVLAAAVAGVLGALTALPALRLGSDFLAVFTIGLAFVVESFYAYAPPSWFGGPLGLQDVPPLRVLGHAFGTRAVFVTVAAAVVLCVALDRRLEQSWLGLAFRSVREDELASQLAGHDTGRLKVLAFAAGAAHCGLAGSLYAQFMGSVSPSDFGFLPSLLAVTMVNVGGIGTLRGAVAGALVLSLLPEVFRFVQEYRNLVYGALLVTVMMYQPAGLLGDDSYLVRALRGRRRRRRPAPAPPAGDVLDSATAPAPLEVRDVRVDFGGLRALDGVSLGARPGEICGVIGPNGAGKTTLFNVVSGIQRPRRGSVRLDGRALQGASPHAIARWGVGRTCQIVRPFAALSVLENVLVAYGARRRASVRASLRRWRRDPGCAAARGWLRLVDLDGYAEAPARTLPLALLRRLEIARALASGARVLLLDEPFAGLTPAEAERQVELVLALKRAGKAILLIEHDMDVALRLCDRLVVLDFGRKIAEGPPREVREDAAVVAAYLGAVR